jgi:alpha-beta hydrolase superfamily lysophospholipase
VVGRRQSISRAGLAAFFSTAVAIASSASADPFYDATPEEVRGRPGSIIRVQQIGHAPHGAAAYKVLYRSEGLRNEPIAISGVVVVPVGAVPQDGRPVVAWAHPTTGVARHCAPSLVPQILSWIPGLEALLARGFIVAATDYPGLGTVGPHPYLIGRSEGRAVIDSVRAARSVPEWGAGTQFAVWGHSQGGHAALFAGELTRSYAPELKPVGIAAAAPATELGELFHADIRGIEGKVLGAFALWSWSKVFDIPLDDVILPTAPLVLANIASQCNDAEKQLLRIAFAEQAFEREGFLAVDITKTEPWRKLMDENTPRRMPDGIPVFLVQGTSDAVVMPRVTEKFRGILCREGTPVTFVTVPGDHGASAAAGAPAAVDWIAGRFAGQAPPSNC